MVRPPGRGSPHQGVHLALGQEGREQALGRSNEPSTDPPWFMSETNSTSSCSTTPEVTVRASTWPARSLDLVLVEDCQAGVLAEASSTMAASPRRKAARVVDEVLLGRPRHQLAHAAVADDRDRGVGFFSTTSDTFLTRGAHGAFDLGMSMVASTSGPAAPAAAPRRPCWAAARAGARPPAPAPAAGPGPRPSAVAGHEQDHQLRPPGQTQQLDERITSFCRSRERVGASAPARRPPRG